MNQNNSAFTLLRRRLNPDQLANLAFELAALQYEDEPYELETSLNTEELWNLACVLRIIVKTNCLHLSEKHLPALENRFRHITCWYEDRGSKVIVDCLKSEL